MRENTHISLKVAEIIYFYAKMTVKADRIYLLKSFLFDFAC